MTAGPRLLSASLSEESGPALDAACRDVVAPFADAVDADGRFPHESIEALRRCRVFGLAVPPALGGGGATLAELADVSRRISAACGSTGMIWAMNEIQLACIARHAHGDRALLDFLTETTADQSLVASVTSEAGVGGNIRESIAPLERLSSGYRIDKRSTAISYGEHAGAFLVTARRAADAPRSDQVAVVVQREDVRLDRTGTWDTLGMRATCSPPFRLVADFDVPMVLGDAFDVVAAETMVPYSHVLWAACWLGIAEAAVARAQAYVRSKERTTGVDPSPGFPHLARAHMALDTVRGVLANCIAVYDASGGPGGSCSAPAGTLRFNNLKVVASEQAVVAAREALAVCGFAGFSQQSPHSVGRHLRDLLSAPLMVSNDRLLATNETLAALVRPGNGYSQGVST